MKNIVLKITVIIILMLSLIVLNNVYATTSFNYKRKSMRVYDKLDLNNIITTDSSSITFSSSNENIATVDNNGIVVSKAQGQAKIIAKDENSQDELILSCGFLVGMDVSHWNGNIDWDDVKQSGIDFVMIRSSYGWYDDSDAAQGKAWDYQYDSYLRTNIDHAVEYGIDYGVYHFSYATNVEQANLEADYVLAALNDTGSKDKISLPVAYDLEYVTNVDKNTMTDMAIAFCTKIAKAGYIPMIYANGNYFMNHLDILKLNAMLYNFWYAWPTNSPNFEDKITISSSDIIPMMWQYSWTGDIDGAQTSGGGLDMDILYLKDRVKVELYDEGNYVDFVGVDKGGKIEQDLPSFEKNGYTFDGFIDKNGTLVNNETIYNENSTLNTKYTRIDVEKISAINDQIEVDKVYDYYIAIKVNPENAILYDGEVKYEIEDPSIISVSNDGKINPLKDGTTNVKCYLSDNEDIFTIVKVNVHLDYMLGDLNEDWIINADDAAEAIEIFKTNAQTDYNKARGDMNSDNKVDAEDAALIIEYFKTHK